MKDRGRKMGRRRFGAILLSLSLAAGGLSLAGAAASELPTEPLVITTASGQHRFEVEIARTEAEQARGLMHRRYLPADRGMIFDYPDVELISMWMENTFISLDMLFVGPDGRIIRIAERTEPFSRRLIPSGGPVRAVVELNAGTAARIGAKVGDSVAVSFIGGL